MVQGCEELLILHVDIGSTIEQEVDSFYLCSSHCVIQRCLAIIIDVVWVSAKRYQSSTDLYVALSHPIEDWSLAIGIHMIDGAAQFHHLLTNVRFTFPRCIVQGCLSKVVQTCGVHSQRDQVFNHPN